MSLGRVAKRSCDPRRVLTSVVGQVGSCCTLLRARGRDMGSLVTSQCAKSLFHGSKFRQCASTGKGFLTRLLHMRPSKQLVLRSRVKARQACLFGRMRCSVWWTTGGGLSTYSTCFVSASDFLVFSDIFVASISKG